MKELASVNDRHSALQSEQRKMVAAMEKLDRVRTELTVELSCRAKEFESTRKTADATSLELEDAKAKFDHERIAKERALERLGSARSRLREEQGRPARASREQRVGSPAATGE